MSDLRYQVIFRGDLVAGFTAADVKANMARLFKAGPETIAKLFSGRPLAIKKGLSQAQAEQLQATLAKIGAQSSLRPEGAVPAAPPATPADRAPVGSDAWTLAPMEGNLLQEHERERTEAVQVEVSHLNLKPAQGNLLEQGERKKVQPAPVTVPDWQLD
ncbi:hypothetical protein [Microbulbifer sp. TYP-18]|uniref:hypothetical protein n=1 Tax=Microbulbifer sp. TYP-18 TaxID=3230024 RepID=UPI0034C6BAC7